VVVSVVNPLVPDFEDEIGFVTDKVGGVHMHHGLSEGLVGWSLAAEGLHGWLEVILVVKVDAVVLNGPLVQLFASLVSFELWL
jgi:hypothetical protein